VQADPAPGTLPPDLARRLAAAGISDTGDPVAAWRKLREAEGLRVSGIDLYWLAARQRADRTPAARVLVTRPGRWWRR
jgi:hypothetical protein